jgi:thiamine pyrophosphokinase
MSRAGEPSACTAIVLAGGDRAPASLRARLPAAGVVIAADGGLAQAVALGLTVDVVVGDFDSVAPGDLAAAEGAGARVERHPAAKEHTDLELALVAARDRGANHVVVVGAWGGRVDHELANLLLLGSDAFASMTLEAIDARGRVVAVRDHVEITGAPGDLVTLLTVGGPATGVRTSGLRYPLHGETLVPGSSRGVSNELVEAVATVAVATGVVLVAVPNPEVV